MKQQRLPSPGPGASIVFPELSPIGTRLTARGNVASKPSKTGRITTSADAAKIRSLKTTAMSLASVHEFGDLYVNFMRERKRVFVDQLGWNLPTADDMEFDQYDNPFCRLVAVHEYGEILAGIRLSPTTARVGLHSYMLRDAQLGLLENIPNDVLFFDAPVDATVWEATRVFISDTVSADRRPLIQRALINQMVDTARKQGANSIIGIVPSIYPRWLRRLNLDAVPVGPKFDIDGSRLQAILFNINHSIQ
ncbi:acyl-homoserine-lactone synthase [Alisedimentitalea sp. MJ-SS2]|uniref:acyl-homoserine-lactone synthase n=1 Tax=Aliisedimentitalea sp. MJ-SS2 TaxID=3049795 RepID=UPI00290936FF|nr:acyl-homoserine-lactone synthase [Alisedimentitalea sp. MJ-SS2]MDU8926865.1 acyl-homoserine-lactone synthase [Alisedimentitalea sp. MJ-SS2]